MKQDHHHLRDDGPRVTGKVGGAGFGLVLALALIAGLVTGTAQDTAFSFRGRLEDAGAAATGAYDLRFAVFDAEEDGAQQGVAVAQDGVGVTNGEFRVTLDFGPGVFDGAARWLDIEARKTAEAAYHRLTPRQRLLPTPYAIHATSAGGVTGGALTGGMIAGGQVVRSLNGLTDEVNLTAGANITLTPKGQNLEIAAAGAGAGGGDSVFSLNGSSAYYLAGNVGLGTSTPSARLQVHSNGSVTPMILSTGGGPDGPGSFRIQADSGLSAGRPALVVYDDTFSKYLMVLNGWSGMGLGTTLPRGNLHIHNPGGTATFVLSTGSGSEGPAQFRLQADSSLGGQGPSFVVYDDTASQYRLAINGAGNVGVGTTSPATRLDVAGDIRGTRLVLRADPQAPANATVLCADPNVSNFVPYNTANARPLSLIANEATVRVLTITGGADIAEPFRMTPEEIAKGSVVVIDEANPGQLKLSTKAYDSHVAGVVSGANGVQPGLRLHQEGVIGGGENVALSGRVYVQADATLGAIQPGDLLTTSDTPGHAMKVQDRMRAQGAILGKAMGLLREGRGLVLVLVTLQ